MTRSHEDFVIAAGIRTPFARAGGVLSDRHAEDLGALATRELLQRTGVPLDRLDGLIAGNVGQQSRAANVARVIALRAGLPHALPAVTVHRNCASGFEAVTQAAALAAMGHGRLFVAVGCESMSNYPLVFGDSARRHFAELARSRSFGARLRALSRFRPRDFAPQSALLEGLRDPVVGLGMGETAEILAREWRIERAAQDAFARDSHRKALEARPHIQEETCDVVHGRGVLRDDDGVRDENGLRKLETLPTVFARRQGSVTAGNSSQITDGAVALLVGLRSEVEALGLEPLGVLEAYAYAGCDPSRMGLGPVHAMDRLFADRDPDFDTIDLFEINEAFAAQVLAVVAASADANFCRERLGRARPLGVIPRERLNVRGGAIALGHPVGSSGARLILSSLLELRRRGASRALLSLCVGGGQGGVLLVRRPA